MFDPHADAQIRSTVFNWLGRQIEKFPHALPRELLLQGLEINGRRVPLLSAQGIFKPAVMELPLSITTSPKSPYNDAFEGNDLLCYRYRGKDPFHRDNIGLREVGRRRLPLIYFHGLAPSRYAAIWPVFVVGDDAARLTFQVAADDFRAMGTATAPGAAVGDESTDIRRRYVTSTVRRRLHQGAFRERVLDAYKHECAFCRFRHDELLDAAHITPDSHEEGEPVVSNGLSLCKLHHAAFDHGFIGLRPDLVLEVRPDILAESDGPTLKHGLQGLHHTRIIPPRRPEWKPEPGRLEERYRRFLDGA